MKLYLPTTSLNFNDIFATESISPKFFYKNRTYGTKRHFTTELCLNDYCISLFKKIPYFELLHSSNSEYEEFPIVLEFNINPQQHEFIKVNDDIYITYKTIYLDLNNVKVLFFSKADYNTIIAKSQLVNETKTISKYKSKFIIVNDKNFAINLNLPVMPKLKSDEEISNELERDMLFNHIKGFYYGYISNKVILSYKKRHLEFSKSVESLERLRELVSLYKQLNTKNAEIILDLTNLSLKYAEKDIELSKKLYDDIISGFAIFKLNNENGIEFNKDKTLITNEMIVFQIILNCILAAPKTKVLDASKEEIQILINNIGNELIKVFGSNSTYIKDNNLIYEKVVRRVYSIDILSLNSYVLQNFLAFALKYNNIDELSIFLESKKIRNSNLAYSFLGAFKGFSGLSRTITHSLFSDDNEELLSYIDTIIIDFREHIWTNTDNRKTQYDFPIKSMDSSPSHSISNVYVLDENIILDTQKTQAKSFTKSNQYSQDHINELETQKLLYREIQRIKISKLLDLFLKRSSISLPGDIQVTFENVGADVDITFLDSKHDKIINIELKNKVNLTNEEESLFKENLFRLGISKSSCSGNYPIFKYSKTVGDENQQLNNEEESYLLAYLRLLK